MNNIELIRNVLNEEAQAIVAVAESVDESYEELVDMCISCKGKLIVTGMGKSGHVARKISATLSSLGTPSLYLHPGEAAHGDLGVVESEDIVLMISKSGETTELKQITNSLKIIGCKLVGVFCERNSSLESVCDLTIVLPFKKEACINGLAPTTSSTITLAFGDALAIALSEKKSFDKQNFALFHPEGSLGKRLLIRAKNLLSGEYADIAAYADETVESLLWKITNNRMGAVSIVDKNNELIGIVSDGDIRRAIKQSKNFLSLKAVDIMTTTPFWVSESTLAIDTLRIMTDNKVSVIPVVGEDDVLKGMISYHDIVKVGIGGIDI